MEQWEMMSFALDKIYGKTPLREQLANERALARDFLLEDVEMSIDRLRIYVHLRGKYTLDADGNVCIQSMRMGDVCVAGHEGLCEFAARAIAEDL